MLEAKHVTKRFRRNLAGKDTGFTALEDVSIQVGEGKILGLMGPSGCGKSTLARVLLRLIPAEQGEVWYRGEDVTRRVGRALRPFRQHVQLIPQRPEGFFDPSMKLGSSVVEPLKIFGIYRREELERELPRALKQVKLDRSLLDRYPHQVSGGEIQRLAICRALLLNPKVLVLDEATSMLDVSVQAQVLHILRELQESENLSYLFISHDRAVVEWMTKDIFEMDKGRIVSQRS